jgi:sortase A
VDSRAVSDTPAADDPYRSWFELPSAKDEQADADVARDEPPVPDRWLIDRGPVDSGPAAAAPGDGQPVDNDGVDDEPFARGPVDSDDGHAQDPVDDIEIPDDASELDDYELTSHDVVIERIRTVVRGVGQTLISFGVVILLFVAYELWVTDLFNKHTQNQLASQLSQTWDQGGDPLDQATVTAPGEPGNKVRNIPIGTGIALIRIPALGLDYVRVIVEGTGEASLAEGPGHYVDTALPGQVGNFSVAGHRVGQGSPFLDLDRLRAGDPIVIETKTSYFIYRVLGDRSTGNPQVPDRTSGIPGQEIVDPSDIDVITPTPDKPGAAASGRYLTLTTCHPRFSARQRMIIHALQDGQAWPKSKGLPPVLRG